MVVARHRRLGMPFYRMLLSSWMGGPRPSDGRAMSKAHEIFDPEHDKTSHRRPRFHRRGRRNHQSGQTQPDHVHRPQRHLELLCRDQPSAARRCGATSGPVPRDIGTSTAANVGDTVTDNAYGIGDARVMNDGNRFRRFSRSPHIDLGPRRANHGNTNDALPRDPNTARISSVMLWCSRFGDNCSISRPGEITSPQIDDSNRRFSGPGQCDTAVTASVCPHPGD